MKISELVLFSSKDEWSNFGCQRRTPRNGHNEKTWMEEPMIKRKSNPILISRWCHTYFLLNWKGFYMVLMTSVKAKSWMWTPLAILKLLRRTKFGNNIDFNCTQPFTMMLFINMKEGLLKKESVLHLRRHWNYMYQSTKFCCASAVPYKHQSDDQNILKLKTQITAAQPFWPLVAVQTSVKTF